MKYQAKSNSYVDLMGYKEKESIAGLSTVGQTHFKKEEMDGYRSWLKENNYDWEDPKLSLGYAKLGQVDLEKTFDTTEFSKIYSMMSKNLNINKIKIIGEDSVDCDYPYSLKRNKGKRLHRLGSRFWDDLRGGPRGL